MASSSLLMIAETPLKLQRSILVNLLLQQIRSSAFDTKILAITNAVNSRHKNYRLKPE